MKSRNAVPSADEISCYGFLDLRSDMSVSTGVFIPFNFDPKGPGPATFSVEMYLVLVALC